MTVNHPITDLLHRHKPPVLSVEFFPPKSQEGGDLLLETAEQIRKFFQPDFVSITYGAGGSTRERTLQYAWLLKEEYGFEVMPHLTCVGHSKAELAEILKKFRSHAFKNIMALRGDPPQGETKFKPHPNGCHYASELVSLIKEHYPNEFCIGVAGYPEKHPEAPSPTKDLDNLEHKVDQGASFITTQLFYNNTDYFQFVENCRNRGINVPIIAGILPVVSLKQVERFCKLCGSTIPKTLRTQLEQASANGTSEAQVGLEWAYNQVKELIEKGAPGIHLYILNRSESALKLLEKLKANNILSKAASLKS